MKTVKSIIAIVSVMLMSFAFVSNSSAQDVEKYHYKYTDTKKHVTYSIYLKFKGYQSEVWLRSSSAATTTEWAKATITYSDDEHISYSYKGTKYKITMDEYNHDAIQLQIGDSDKRTRYFLYEE